MQIIFRSICIFVTSPLVIKNQESIETKKPSNQVVFMCHSPRARKVVGTLWGSVVVLASLHGLFLRSSECDVSRMWRVFGRFIRKSQQLAPSLRVEAKNAVASPGVA